MTRQRKRKHERKEQIGSLTKLPQTLVFLESILTLEFGWDKCGTQNAYNCN